MERPVDAREAPDYPNYWVTEAGVVWSANKRRILKQAVDRDGYLYVTAQAITGPSRPIRIHQIMCSAFHGGRPTAQHQVRHVDGNRQHNRPSNLAWGTPKENTHDRYSHGTIKFGETNPLAKLDQYKVRAIRLLSAYKVSSTRIGEIFAIHPSTARKIACRHMWNHV